MSDGEDLELDSDESFGFTENENDVAWMTVPVVIQVAILIGESRAAFIPERCFNCSPLPSEQSDPYMTIYSILQETVCPSPIKAYLSLQSESQRSDLQQKNMDIFSS
jgi:hypothetical protein